MFIIIIFMIFFIIIILQQFVLVSKDLILISLNFYFQSDIRRRRHPKRQSILMKKLL